MYDDPKMIYNCRNEGCSASLCAKLIFLRPGPSQGGRPCSVYTLNCCHEAIVFAATIWPKKKWESSIKNKYRDNWDICLPNGRHSCHNFQLEWLILVTPLRSISRCQQRFYSSGRSKQNKKPITYSLLSLFWWVSNSLAPRTRVSAKKASAHSLKFKPIFPNVGVWDRTAGFIILTTSQVM